MTVQVGIVDDPFDPAAWTRHEVDDVLAFLRDRFGSWPANARIYDMAGFGDWTRAAAVLDPQVLAARDVTPVDPEGIDRLRNLPGPLMVALPPADPLTALIVVGAIIVGAIGAFLLVPKIPTATNQQTQSPNNSLAARSNKPRPNARVPDIFGTVRSVPDMLSVPYTLFENNQEVEIAFLCVGRGAYAVEDVRDGDTLIAAISGAGASIYAPYTSPNSGDAPQTRIGTAIEQPILTVAKASQVNGQTLRAPNSNYVKGATNVSFVAPDTIEVSGSDDPLDEKFSPGDQLTVANAEFGGVASYFNATTQNARFYPDYRIEFQGFDPTTLYAAGQALIVTNAGFTAIVGTETVFVDLSGTYVIQGVTNTTIQLVH